MRVFYDLTCPFCYLAQPINKQLRQAGIRLTELPFQAHPEVPAQGIYIGPRHGPMYDSIAAQAKTLNLPLNWRDVLPNPRPALAAAEWTRVHDLEKSDQMREKLFDAHFAGGQDIGDPNVVADIAEECGVDSATLRQALGDGSAFDLVVQGEALGKSLGVESTPTWESNGVIVSGLREEDVREVGSTGEIDEPEIECIHAQPMHFPRPILNIAVMK